MSDIENIVWESEVENQFNRMIEKIPGPMKKTATKAVTKKAAEFASKEKREKISEKDMIDAFFETTPYAFHGLMMSDMDAVGIDYKQYGHPIDYTGGFFKK